MVRWTKLIINFSLFYCHCMYYLRKVPKKSINIKIKWNKKENPLSHKKLNWFFQINMLRCEISTSRLIRIECAEQSEAREGRERWKKRGRKMWNEIQLSENWFQFCVRMECQAINDKFSYLTWKRITYIPAMVPATNSLGTHRAKFRANTEMWGMKQVSLWLYFLDENLIWWKKIS